MRVAIIDEQLVGLEALMRLQSASRRGPEIEVRTFELTDLESGMFKKMSEGLAECYRENLKRGRFDRTGVSPAKTLNKKQKWWER